jgi:acetyl-CoA synthetase
MIEQKRFHLVNGYVGYQRKVVPDIEKFWGDEAEKLPWFKHWNKTLVWDEPFAKWFEGGLINASYCCLDAHINTPRRNKVAIYWEDEFGNTRTYSYHQLFNEVNRFASALKNLGVKKGDIIMLYVSMVPELTIAMLAAARLGAVHSVVFSGFSAQALCDRINDTDAKFLVTQDFGLRRGKFIPLKDVADQALATCPTIKNQIVIKRTDKAVNMVEGRDVYYHEILKTADKYVEPEQVEATHPLFILYTSGTTGKPKGIVHSTGGYLVQNHTSFKWVFNPEEDSVYWCTADIGWITGHSYVVYSPLLHGITSIMYEGSPDYPTIDRWWDIIARYGVTIFYTSPTAIRMFMRFGDEYLKKHDLSSLKVLGSVGEPINRDVWKWYFVNIGREKCPVVDTWWQTETGSILVSPVPGLNLVPLKPGSATLPVPGIDADIVNEAGQPVGDGERGYFVINKPWPSMLMTIHKDPERYKQVYWSRFKGRYFAGDFATRDTDGYLWFLGRSDETLKVAGHRIGTAEVETAAVAMPFVAEAAVVGVPDQLKGEAIVLFAILKQGYQASDELKAKLVEGIRTYIGPIATPQAIHFVGKLPKTRSGKIMRRILKAVAEGKEIGDVTTLEDDTFIDDVKKSFEELKSSVKVQPAAGKK